MNRYRLDARRFSGPLYAPTRNDIEAHESDDLDALRELARPLVARGYTVWLYERVIRSTDPVTCEQQPAQVYVLRLIDQRGPELEVRGTRLVPHKRSR